MKIDPSKMYSIGDIVKEGLIPGLTTIRKASEFVVKDKNRDNVLGARWVWKGTASRLEMPGYKIIEHLKNNPCN